MTKSMQDLWQSSQLSGGNMSYVESLYESYLQDAASVPAEWLAFFQSLPATGDAESDVSHSAVQDYFRQQAEQGGFGTTAVSDERTLKQSHVMKLINAYREHGHLQASLDPIAVKPRQPVPDLSLAFHGLSEADLEQRFHSESPMFDGSASLSAIKQALDTTYCGHLGVEYRHISNQAEVKWIQDRIEGRYRSPGLRAEQKKHILQQLTLAEGLEKYLGSKYVGQKRFSLEGAESFIAILDAMIDRSAEHGVKEIVLGMAHRGRINVLVNILGKSPAILFQEFEGLLASDLTGDVKYHMGFSANRKTAHGHVHLALAFNPSHLEIIAPVVAGSVRSRLRRRDDLARKQSACAIHVHGDAAFAGQGVVMETLNLSQIRGYATGGSIHVIINNQIGFTTSNPLDSRSTLYCSDIAKAFQVPIFHVNGDDPEACVEAAQIATDYRNRFHKDVVVDLVCYRRHGHNEADEPAITQPKMYQVIRKKATTRDQYAATLRQQGVITESHPEALLDDLRTKLDKSEVLVHTGDHGVNKAFSVDWQPFFNSRWDMPVTTSVPQKQLTALSAIVNHVPKTFNLHPVVKRLISDRQKMTAGELPINWGYAEMMAYATLLDAGYPVRLSGQDSGRGTFSHRHAVLHDVKTGECHIPLQSVSTKRNQAIIIDSVLSEEAVLAFEYGYAASEPNVLVIWEAQFGDFVNGAQVVIDQFISSAEQKWGRLNGLVMFLPHGYEGQGPEHSSARLERFMQLCAQHNMQVCTPTTPAQIFHLLRRQMLRAYRKPLVVMTPKSLLRHKLAVSTLDDLSQGAFRNVIPEIDAIDASQVRRVVLCGGKVYYDLLQQRREANISDVALLRIEQLYPFPKKELMAELAPYAHVRDIIWCQEEPKNQGAWFSSAHNIAACLTDNQTLNYVGRDFFAAPAVGHAKLHIEQQHAFVKLALTLNKRK